MPTEQNTFNPQEFLAIFEKAETWKNIANIAIAASQIPSNASKYLFGAGVALNSISDMIKMQSDIQAKNN